MLRVLALAAFLIGAAPLSADTLAITGARIHTMGPAGDIAGGTILVSNGRIAAVGANVRVPRGAEVFDAAGRTVTPGLFVAGTNIGALEIDQVVATNDTSTKNTTLSAAFDVQYGIDPWSVTIPVARIAGITSALVTPGYADAKDRELLFAGQAAVITLADGARPVVRPRAAMVLELGERGAARTGGGRGSAIAALKADIDDVRLFMRRRHGYDAGATRDLRLSRADLEALAPVVRGRMKLIVAVRRAEDIRQVLALARTYGLKIVLAGAEEAWIVARDIARANVPVLLNATSNLPENFETRGATLDNAARLDAAGVTIAFASGDGKRAREARADAGNAVAHGLPYRRALAALTINPARIFGDAARASSIERGKSADLVVWSGDPLEPLSLADAVFIAGKSQPLTSRQEDLARRYKSLNEPLPPAYRD